jgi:thiamine kinase-like enzyme
LPDGLKASQYQVLKYLINEIDELAESVYQKKRAIERESYIGGTKFLTTLTFFDDYLTKKFTLSSDRVNQLLEVYAAIDKLPNCIQLQSLKLDGKEVKAAKRKSSRNKDETSVEIQLAPLGALRPPKTPEDLKAATSDVLLFLEAFHKKGFVHRDLRWDNIIRMANGYSVIDFELAACNDE